MHRPAPRLRAGDACAGRSHVGGPRDCVMTAIVDDRPTAEFAGPVELSSS
ncbi:MAG: hypothetical protein ACLT8E_09865 [Akkermansia sp.]